MLFLLTYNSKDSKIELTKGRFLDMKKGDYFCVNDFIFIRGEQEEYTVYYNEGDVAGIRIENGKILLDFNGEDKLLGLTEKTEFTDSHEAYEVMKLAAKILKEEFFPKKGK